MATRKIEQPTPLKTKLTKPRDWFVNELKQRTTIGKELLECTVKSVVDLDKLKKDYNNWNNYNEELLKQSFNNPNSEYYNSYSNVNFMVGVDDVLLRIDIDNPQYQLQHTIKCIDNSVTVLEQLLTKLPLIEQDETEEPIQTKERNFSNCGFLVHGHNDTKKLEIARFIENELKREIIILHEKSSKGRTIIEKFEAHSQVDFAVALWTADDVGKANTEEEFQNRARQNVVFETGFFIGKIGRENVIVLYEDGVEVPSDYSGVIFIRYIGNWKEDLRKEISAIYNQPYK